MTKDPFLLDVFTYVYTCMCPACPPGSQNNEGSIDTLVQVCKLKKKLGCTNFVCVHNPEVSPQIRCIHAVRNILFVLSLLVYLQSYSVLVSAILLTKSSKVGRRCGSSSQQLLRRSWRYGGRVGGIGGRLPSVTNFNTSTSFSRSPYGTLWAKSSNRIMP